jgi:hypothetical protein
MAPRNPQDRLYDLLPALYRDREERANRFPLRDLLRLVTEQADIVHADIEQLWKNFFIDTSDRWAIPYIGDLVSNNLLHDGFRGRMPDTAGTLFLDLSGRDLSSGRDLFPGIAIRTSTDVAKTVYYRRRKGTLPMLEELARDVTGWAAHAVEFFELLEWSQHLDHLRLYSLDAPDLRRIEPIDRLNGPFDAISHTVDVRPIAQSEGWYNIPNIGFFLWRLQSYPLFRVRARPTATAWQYHFSPLGNRAPLFSRGAREADERNVATELDIPAPIRPAAFYEDLEGYRAALPPTPTNTKYYGLFEAAPPSPMLVCPDCSFVIIADGVPVDPANLRCRNLGNWTQPPLPLVGVDVELGRIAFSVPPRKVDVYYHYGFSADMGGGPYARPKWLVRPELAALRLTVRETPRPGEFPTLGAALVTWVNLNRPDAIITIADNRTYNEPMRIELKDDAWLVIEAADRTRPHLMPQGGELVVEHDHPGSELTLSGLLIEGAVHVEGDLARLRVLHCTLVPGRALNEDGSPVTTLPGVTADATSAGQRINTRLKVQVAFSITGPIRLPDDAQGLWLLDAIVDGVTGGGGAKGTAISAVGAANRPGPPGTIERSTIFGRSFFTALPMASEVVFADVVEVSQRQEGCVRFSFVPVTSSTPRRYRCQPDAEIESQIATAEKAPGFAALSQAQQAAIRVGIRIAVPRWLVPTFTSFDYGAPAYAQLRLSSPVQVRTGAEDGSEMGAFCHLKQPQRETNLRIRLDEYLPFGLDAGLLYVT